MRTLIVPVALVAALAGSLAAASEARADDGAVIVVGTAASRDRMLIAGAIEVTARAAAWSLGPALAAKDVDVVVACLAADRPWPCIEPIAKARGLLRLVVVHATRERADGAPQLVLTGQLVLAGNSVPAIDRRYCAPCSDAELAAAAAELTRRLLADSASRTGTALLDVRTAPPGAAVSIDGRVVGESNRTFATHPGPHELLLQRAGYRAEVRTVAAREGEATLVSVALSPEAARAGMSRGRRIAPLVLAGAGVLAVAAGSYASFTADASEAGPEDKYVYSGAGIGVALAGAAAIGAGVVLWLRTPHRASAPTLSIVSGGGVAGWTTRL